MEVPVMWTLFFIIAVVALGAIFFDPRDWTGKR